MLTASVVHEASNVIRSRLKPHQVAAFKWWERTGRDQYDNGPEKLLDLIRATNFLQKASRNKLVSALLKAIATVRPQSSPDAMMPMGNLGGYRYAFWPEVEVCKLERASEDEEHYPPVPAELLSDNQPLRGPYVWLWERTYDEIWCPPSLFGEPQRRYGRRSGGDVLGGPPTDGHWGGGGGGGETTLLRTGRARVSMLHGYRCGAGPDARLRSLGATGGPLSRLPELWQSPVWMRLLSCRPPLQQARRQTVVTRSWFSVDCT